MYGHAIYFVGERRATFRDSSFVDQIKNFQCWHLSAICSSDVKSIKFVAKKVYVLQQQALGDPMDSLTAAKNVYTWIMRPLTKYLKLTRQHEKHPAEAVTQHIERWGNWSITFNVDLHSPTFWSFSFEVFTNMIRYYPARARPLSVGWCV